MKQRLLSVFAMLSLMISGVMAQTFTISTDCEGYFIAGDRVEVSINVEGAQEMTALQFNFSLPEGFTLSEGWPIYMGNATNGHAMNASILDSGDLFVVLYSLHSGTFDDGTLISFNVTAAEDAVSAQGKLYNVRTATTDAVSHTLSDVTFAMNIASEEPEPTWHLSGPATEEEITTQSYIDGLVYNQTTKPRTITLKKGYNVIIIPSSWTTPTFGLVSDFSKRYTPFTSNDLGITNPSNKNVLVLYSEVENATCYVKWGTNVVPEPEPEPEAKYYWYVGTTEPTCDADIEALGQQSTEAISSLDVTDSNNFQYIAYPKSWGVPTLIDSSNDFEFSINFVASLNAAFDSNPESKYYCRRIGKNTGDVTLAITWKQPEYSVSLGQTSLVLTAGNSVTLTATITPEEAANESVRWQSYDENIATVENGIVTAVAEGSTYIYAKVGDYFAACQVTVEAATVEEPEGLIAGKNYRVKNVTTGLYMQVEGNNTNMKLQNKAEDVELSQVFQLEDAGEGMYYIKAADLSSSYYAHASGWNFNATANAANKTPFTIALVEGETQVYTLHQSVSANTGLAGTDAAEAGAAIYCNKGVDNNGKWAFEALTEEENAAYTATLTATARQAVEEAIAHGEAVAANRSAVLTAEETATINNAVQAAREGKDAAADVTALKALSDAIHTAVDEAVYVWNTDALSNAMCYAVSTEDRGAWYAQASNLTSTAKAEAAVDVADSKQQFAFVKSPKSGALYLYSVSEAKFVSAADGYTALTETPVQTVAFLNGTRSAQFPWVVALNAEDGQKQMGISNGYDPAVITHYNDLGDAGNTVRIEKVAAFDASAALAAIEALETGINKLTNDNSQLTIYDLQGRKVENPAKGIYIVGGKKTVIK